MTRPSGLLITFGDGKRADKIEQAVEMNGQFTTVVDSADVSVTEAGLAFISLHGDAIDYVGLVRPGHRVATGQKLLSVSNLTAVTLDADMIRRALPEKFRGRLANFGKGVRRLPPGTWDALRDAVIAKGQGASDAIREIVQKASFINSSKRHVGSDIDLFDHDAVATALEVWGGTQERKKILRSARPPASKTAPFLERLAHVSLREDPQINHDAQSLPGMRIAQRYQVGAITLENATERLTIINCNRQPLEKTLGVDLIYYNHRFKSFVMVQYKRMTATSRTGDREGYRPHSDANHASELKRMVGINKILISLPRGEEHDLAGYRLSRCPFYFKLCRDRSSRPLDESMVSGMYIPLGLWRKMLASDQTLGRRGGKVFDWDTCARRFNNSEFTSLLRNGWIGSRASQSQKLGDIIEQSLSAKHMVVYAATSPSSTHEDYLRDDFGRFASDDDPNATR